MFIKIFLKKTTLFMNIRLSKHSKIVNFMTAR